MNNNPNQQGYPNFNQQGNPYPPPPGNQFPPQQGIPVRNPGYNNLPPGQHNLNAPLIQPNNVPPQNDGYLRYHRNIDNQPGSQFIQDYISQPTQNIIMTDEVYENTVHRGPLPRHSVVVHCPRCNFTGHTRVVREIDPGCLCCLIVMILFPPFWIFLLFFCCCIECCGRVDIHKCNSCRNFIGYAKR